jgi:nitrite reductase (NO-forming)
MGGAALLGGTMLGRFAAAPAAAEDDPGYPGLGSSAVHSDGSASLYGHAHEPPSSVAAGDLDRVTFPPAESTLEVDMDVVEQTLEVGANVFFPAWTYSGTVPGPILRARAGETIEVRLRNLTSHPHNLHFHGAHSPEMDGWEPIPAGEEFVYRIEAGPPGVHPYHCHVAPLAEHIARGLYGMLIVDPPEGRPPAHEVALLLSGFAVGGIPNAVMAWNGVAGYYARYPIKVPQGELVRAYVVNMTEYEPVGSFHLHARTFDVYPSGMGERPTFAGDTVTMGQGERAMLEFTLPDLGRYMFHPHQHHLADRGAMGWFAAV